MKISSPTPFGTPAVLLSTAVSAGTSGEALRTDDTIIAFDTTVPSTQAFGDSAATGSQNVSARRDHKHQMMANPTVQADEDEAEDEDDVDKYIPPNFIRFSPGVAKGWCRIEQDGSILGGTAYPNSYNVSATSTAGTGDYLVTWRDDFTQTTYVVASTTADAGEYNSAAGTFAVGSVQIYNTTCNSGAAANYRSSVIGYGDQVQ